MLHCRVSSLTTYVFDLDGIMYLGDTAIPHASAAIARLNNSAKKIYFLTNNSGRTRISYVEKLRLVNGINVSVDSIFTSAYATALYLRQQGASGCSVFVVGEAGLAQELEEVGGLRVITVPDSVSPDTIDFVVAGIDRQFTYDKLRFAHAAIKQGHAQFIATNRDATFPLEHGEVPGGGAGLSEDSGAGA